MPIGEEEVVANVGAPEAQEAHSAIVEALRDLNQNSQSPRIPHPHSHVQSSLINCSTALHSGAAHCKTLLTQINYTCWNNRGH